MRPELQVSHAHRLSHSILAGEKFVSDGLTQHDHARRRKNVGIRKEGATGGSPTSDTSKLIVSSLDSQVPVLIAIDALPARLQHGRSTPDTGQLALHSLDILDG